MRMTAFICGAIVAATMPAAALADDPHDPAMRNAAARAHDRAMTRQLNLGESARVDARGAPVWHVVRTAEGRQADADYAAGSRDHQRDLANYARDRAQYARDMAKWRRAVAACRDGDYSACEN